MIIVIVALAIAVVIIININESRYCIRKLIIYMRTAPIMLAKAQLARTAQEVFIVGDDQVQYHQDCYYQTLPRLLLLQRILLGFMAFPNETSLSF